MKITKKQIMNGVIIGGVVIATVYLTKRFGKVTMVLTEKTVKNWAPKFIEAAEAGKEIRLLKGAINPITKTGSIWLKIL